MKKKNDYVYAMSENARAPLKEIAQYLHMSPQRLKYISKSLKRDEIIKQAYCIFDYSYFGQLLFRVYFKGGYISETDKERILRALFKNPYIVSVYELTGEYDLVVEFACPNPSRFNKELKQTIALKPTLKDYKIILNLVTYLYPRQYLTDKSDLQRLHTEQLIGGDREQIQFNNNEKQVAKTLLQNPVGRLKSLAEESNLNTRTVKTVIKTLTEKKIIKGFRFVIDTEKLKISKSRMFLKLHNIKPEREQELVQYFGKTKEIIQANKTVGDWDVEIDIESFDRTRTRYIIMQIRKNFADIVANFNLMDFYSYHKRSYLPAYIFSDD